MRIGRGRSKNLVYGIAFNFFFQGLCIPFSFAQDLTLLQDDAQAQNQELSKKSVAIFMDFNKEHKRFGFGESAQELFNNFSKKMTEKYPGVTPKLLQAIDLPSATQKMGEILEEDEQISHLFIDTHGTTYHHLSNQFNQKDFPLLSVGSDEILFGQLPYGEFVESDHQVMAKNFFAPWAGKFVPGAKVYSLSCHFFKSKNADISDHIKALQNSLGIEEGEFYGNRTYGTREPFFLKSPFFMEKNPKNAVFSFFFQILVLGTLTNIVYSLTSDQSPLLKMLNSVAGIVIFTFMNYILYNINQSDQGFRCQFSQGRITRVQAESGNYYYYTDFAGPPALMRQLGLENIFKTILYGITRPLFFNNEAHSFSCPLQDKLDLEAQTLRAEAFAGEEQQLP